MKTKLLLLLSLSFITLKSNAQLQNGSFENWTNMGTYSDPDHWFSYNYVTANFGAITCEEGTPGNPGAKYAKLTSKDVPGIGIMPGTLTSGEYDMSTGDYLPGFAFAQRPANFTGSWQYMAMDTTDMGAMYVMLTKWNTSTQAQDLIGVASFEMVGMEMSWVNFSLPFTYVSSDMPDSAMIYFASSGAGTGSPVDGSYLYIDNLAFSGTATGINEGQAPVIAEVFPNPAKQFVYVAQTNPAKETKFEINSIDGKLVQTGFISGIRAKIELNNLKSGIYFVNLINDGVKTTKRLVISE